ncbi:MAG: (d)CMP kinase [Desulfamplus sp.]|nr:(d)CMP kinase [Desulfamplus sp.]MBF0412185.1 (d)CMP kinase [Desulfamplus sp.]
MKNEKRIITIDGPSGAGKTTISKLLAKHLGYVYVDTGSLYRGVAYEVCRCSINWEDDDELNVLLTSLAFELKLDTGGTYHLFSSGQDITDYIRTPEITMLSSDLSAKRAVRQALLGFQKDIAQKGDAVFEGRDMGTVVFPDANYKFFLSADLKTRALRRYNEINQNQSSSKSYDEKQLPDEQQTFEQPNKPDQAQTIDSTQDIDDYQTLDEIENAISLRDKNDSSRDIAPLKPANDAIMIDSTDLTLEEVVNKIISCISSK